MKYSGTLSFSSVMYFKEKTTKIRENQKNCTGM